MLDASKRIAVFRLVWLIVLVGVSTSQRLNTPAQIRPVYDQGALGLTQLLKRLNTTASALMIGAHPDDEDTALLAYLARGENSRTAYLSLTRGDGGQNIIGPELGEALGVIRTEELLQARKLDGADQFFTRAYDYGFSKTLAEAKEKWDEKIILCDVVRVIRSYRPLVVISQFSGTAADGHGQHQYAGYITPLAVKAAADPAQCSEAGAVWEVKKLYVRHRGTGEPTLRINTGRYDPLLGRSYFEVAMHARSQHRSQEQGVLELKGDQFSNLTLISGPKPAAGDTGIFDGLQVLRPRFDADVSGVSRQNDLIPKLADLVTRSEDPVDFGPATDALFRASGVRIDVLADRETVVAGETFATTVRMFAPPGTPLAIKGIEFSLPSAKVGEPPTGSQGSFRRETASVAEYFNLTVPTNAPTTRPYWLFEKRNGEIFRVPDGMPPSKPLPDPSVIATITLEIGGRQFRIRKPVEYRFADDIRGEIRRDLSIVPKLTADLDRQLLVVSTKERRKTLEVNVNLTNHVNAAVAGKLRLVVPAGWRVVPQDADFAVGRKGERSPFKFSVNIPATAAPGAYRLSAEATMNGETFSETMRTIAYEHIQTHRIYNPATAVVNLFDIQTSPVKVGYIRGSGDRVPEAITQVGLAVEVIDAQTLASGDLSKFDTIVVGIRAYQVRSDVVAYNKRLLDFARDGGTLIVQYQLPPTYSQQNLTPFPTQMGPRVVDENASVTIAEPAHPILNFPNKITAEDFKGWVQERNLYNFVQMDPKYVGLLESHDVGDPENKGGLVVADIGKGKYVYCSYSLFRQLPAGVPGAYRLLANLISQPRAAR